MIHLGGWHCLCPEENCLCYRLLPEGRTEWKLYGEIIVKHAEGVDDPAGMAGKDPKWSKNR